MRAVYRLLLTAGIATQARRPSLSRADGPGSMQAGAALGPQRSLGDLGEFDKAQAW